MEISRFSTYERLKNVGFNPKTCIDVGACYGEWSSIIRNIYPNAIIMGIDANDWNKNKQFPFTDISEVEVLSDEDNKEVIFYKKIEGNCTGDSIFKENTFHYAPNLLVEEKRITKTLNTLCNKNNIDTIDLLKLDTQGSEILIMKGLGKKLNDVEFIEVECSLVEWNLGGCTIVDVIDFLKPNFEIYDILETHRINEFDLIQIDILFKNKNSKIKIII